MKILDIKSTKTYETRTDGRYPLRIGSTVNFFRQPIAGCSMVLEYVLDNKGKPKYGHLVTSTVIDIDETKCEIIVTTKNSIYYFEK